MTSANAPAKPRYQPRPTLRVSTIELILSVTEPNVCPGPMTGGCDGVGPCGWVLSGSFMVGVFRSVLTPSPHFGGEEERLLTPAWQTPLSFAPPLPRLC